MGVIGKKLRSLEGGRVAFMCPGCREFHQIVVVASMDERGNDLPRHGPIWGYNCNPDAPTFTPSIRVGGKQTVIDENGRWTGEWVRGPDGVALDRCCHSFVTDGRIQFLSDCTHALVGQTVDLPDVPA